MNRNKKILIPVVFLIGLSFLIVFGYFSLFKRSKDNSTDSLISFEVPEISDKKGDQDSSKIEYYDKYADPNKIQKKRTKLTKDQVYNSNLSPTYKTAEQYNLPNESFNEKGSINPNDTGVEVSRNNNVDIGLDGDEKSLDDIEAINQFQYDDVINEGEGSSDNEYLDRLLNIMESNAELSNNNIPEGNIPEMLHDSSSQDSKVSEIHEIVGSVAKQKMKYGSGVLPVESKEMENLTVTSISEKAFFGATKSGNAFVTAISDQNAGQKDKLFKAEFLSNQLITNGGLVKIQLLEEIYIDEENTVPKNTVLFGIANAAPSRIFIKVSPNVNIQKGQVRFSSPIYVYDFDGLEGVYVKENLLAKIPAETAGDITELVKDSYKQANPLTGNTGAVPLKEASIIIGSEKILKYLDRMRVNMYGGYKIWLSVDDIK
ncbi:conjugative transposon protein TraM [Galbibacter sp. EGI 63066]|uniref:conjugative transposon protein TraM n=1 Tax=Galbibacter sp. EGI 63066 TaxID=2993559 RepID=UPI00224918C7|nr:conjugative transposon protein TraM [Galbibacter sp. EGI 63066]MCX2681928.1 conjugative transposon protein TraM [Galbibacter sp. EGI 63066]